VGDHQDFVRRSSVVYTAAPQQVEFGVRGQTLPRQETVKQFGNRCVLGVLLFVIVDECQVRCVLLNNVDSIVRRARLKHRERVRPEADRRRQTKFKQCVLGLLFVVIARGCNAH
jgi:hypothetical protein